MGQMAILIRLYGADGYLKGKGLTSEYLGSQAIFNAYLPLKVLGALCTSWRVLESFSWKGPTKVLWLSACECFEVKGSTSGL